MRRSRSASSWMSRSNSAVPASVSVRLRMALTPKIVVTGVRSSWRGQRGTHRGPSRARRDRRSRRLGRVELGTLERLGGDPRHGPLQVAVRRLEHMIRPPAEQQRPEGHAAGALEWDDRDRRRGAELGRRLPNEAVVLLAAGLAPQLLASGDHPSGQGRRHRILVDGCPGSSLSSAPSTREPPASWTTIQARSQSTSSAERSRTARAMAAASDCEASRAVRSWRSAVLPCSSSASARDAASWRIAAGGHRRARTEGRRPRGRGRGVRPPAGWRCRSA